MKTAFPGVFPSQYAFFPQGPQPVSGQVQQTMFYPSVDYYPGNNASVNALQQPMHMPIMLPVETAMAMGVLLNGQPQNTPQVMMIPAAAYPTGGPLDLSSTAVPAGMAQMAPNWPSIAGGSVVANATQPSPDSMQAFQQLGSATQQAVHNMTPEKSVNGQRASRSAVNNQARTTKSSGDASNRTEVAPVAPGEQPAHGRKTPHAVFVDLSGLKQKGTGLPNRSRSSIESGVPH